MATDNSELIVRVTIEFRQVTATSAPDAGPSASRRPSDHGELPTQRGVRPPDPQAIRDFLKAQALDGSAVTGRAVGSKFSRSAATGRRWLAWIRAQEE